MLSTRGGKGVKRYVLEALLTISFRRRASISILPIEGFGLKGMLMGLECLTRNDKIDERSLAIGLGHIRDGRTKRKNPGGSHLKPLIPNRDPSTLDRLRTKCQLSNLDLHIGIGNRRSRKRRTFHYRLLQVMGALRREDVPYREYHTGSPI